MMTRLSNLFTQSYQVKTVQSISPLGLAGIISFAVTVCLFLLNQSINFQVLEWVIYDQYFRLLPTEDIDSRLLIVTVDEPDISQLQQWPLSDANLLNALQQIEKYDPRVIALDIYRDFPVPPGNDGLETFFRNAPHLIGVEKVTGTPVAPPPVLAEQNQVALADIVLDGDGTVRRALLSVKHEGQPKWTLGASAALLYLQQDGIIIDPTIRDEFTLSTGISFPRLQPNQGGYSRVDNRGYQILLKFRGPDNAFETISIQDVLNDRVQADMIRDRIVLIGTIAPSLNDFTYTPYQHSTLTDTSQSPGVAIHAHIASQILSTALDGRSQIRSWSTAAEWGWVYWWCFLGSGLILIPQWHSRRGAAAFISTMVPILGLSIGLIICNGILFGAGWWIPGIPPLLGIVISATVSLSSNNLRLLKAAYVDGLTEVLNRRAFNQQILVIQKQSQPISILLCDIDHFKGYNDFYGHPAGDACIKQVAKAIGQAIRSQDIIARYGGEEFAVILHKTSAQKACEIAERMRQNVYDCQLPHEASPVSDYVSISCGVATRPAKSHMQLSEILAQADQALYEAKHHGRNQISLYQTADIKWLI
ncbi:MAG: CHASE2 domain-containing protein [Leptolyngbya sp. SIOISBB]|nr:CHASE2 domain-containing protein [Leptolyngbya sp. SIOISBB]